MRINETQALQLLDDGELSATDLVYGECPDLLRRYRRNVTALVKTMEDMRESFPDIKLYVASGTLCLMLGDSHDESRNANAQPQLVVDSDNRLNIDGGDW